MSATQHEGAAEMDGGFSVRRATRADVGLVTGIVALAFEKDPLWSVALAHPDGWSDHHVAFWRIFVRGALRYPSTGITANGEATSVWIPPGGTEMTLEQEHRLEELAMEHLGPGADDFLELMSRFDSARPHGAAHYYLSLLGVHPDHRGRGLGMALLAHDLEHMVDAEHVPAYLESSNPANNHRYERLGFEPHGEFSFPGEGPVVTTLWRAAR